MKQKMGNKLQVQIEPANGEKLQNVNFQNVIDAPEEDAILELGEIMTALAIEGSSLKGVVLTTQTRYTK
ncbi:hypothetical protein ACFFH2_14905 [Enterococcus devriesei]|nr:hypothetical protein [Enterococcus devriesei]MDU6524121.1 hypothetical protein [Enterococcus sp.]